MAGKKRQQQDTRHQKHKNNTTNKTVGKHLPDEREERENGVCVSKRRYPSSCNKRCMWEHKMTTFLCEKMRRNKKRRTTPENNQETLGNGVFRGSPPRRPLYDPFRVACMSWALPLNRRTLTCRYVVAHQSRPRGPVRLFACG